MTNALSTPRKHALCLRCKRILMIYCDLKGGRPKFRLRCEKHGYDTGGWIEAFVDGAPLSPINVNEASPQEGQEVRR